jgi:hypothetical protein
MFLKEEKEFQNFFQVIKEMFKYDRRLPKQIFKSPLDYFLICDLDKAIGGQFHNELKNLVSVSKDDYIIMGILDPDPVTFYCKEFGFYNWLRIPANMSEDYYWNMLNFEPNGRPVDCILCNSNTIVWASPSKQWAIWGERQYGIAILGFNKDSELKQQIQENDTWGKMDEDFATLISYNFKEFKLPNEIKDSFFLHYQNKD